MKYLSVCSGIEAASVAWHPLGWEPVGFSEIEPFPCAVLAHRFPSVKNYGDMTKYKEWNIEPGTIDVLVGGTPCQSFSIAGLRKGLADPRGNLMLTFGAIADHYKPAWIVWENVPGVLSSNGGRDFGTFLGMLGKLGYGFAYRVLDAQYFGVPQRRRRVFVVGYLGDWRRAASVLFESEGLCGYPPPSRETGKGIAGITPIGIDGGEVGYSLRATPSHSGDKGDGGMNTTTVCYNMRGRGTSRGIEIGPGGGSFTDVNPTLDTRCKDGPIRNQLAGAVLEVAHTLRGEGFDASEDVMGRGTPIVPVQCFERNTPDGHARLVGDIAPTLNRMGGGQREPCIFTPVIMATGQGNAEITEGHAPTLNCNHEAPILAFGGNNRSGAINVAAALLAKGGSGRMNFESETFIKSKSSVRRLTPRECERLQGFPDNWTLIPWRGARAEDCPDGPRYKAIGNSMAVPVMRWIGERISNDLPSRE